MYLFLDRRDKSGVPDKYFVITNNDIIRNRYLLVFGNKHTAWTENKKNTISVQPKNAVIQWILNNKAIVTMLFYVILLLSIGLANSRNGYYIRQYILTRFQNAYNYISNYFTGSL